MSFSNNYSKIIKYVLIAVCTEPLHIGDASGDPEDVLIHPVDGLPFIQASSIAGVFRNYYQEVFGEESAEILFGGSRYDEVNGTQMGSQINFGDGRFLMDKSGLKMELRPRVSINPSTGTCDTSTVKGTSRQSGHKFNMTYIGAGARFVFPVYLYASELQNNLENIFSAMNREILQFGGQKSNGCGYMKIEKLLCKEFNMRDAEDRKLWFCEESLEERVYSDKTKSLKKETTMKNAYQILVEGCTEGQLLIKSIAVSDYGKGTPDSMNIQNCQGEYIVPGSSFKGAVRNQMEKIVSYLHQQGICDKDVVADAFGKVGTKQQSGKSVNLYFFDTIVGDKEENDLMPLSHRIHIDKFTGGVMHGGLFSEKNIAGNMSFKINVRDKNNPDRTCEILLMVLRDLAAGVMSVGGGYSVGKGVISVGKIKIISEKDGKCAIVDYKNKKIMDDHQLIQRCMSAVYGGMIDNV